MEDFEIKLKSVELAQPSSQLHSRIFQEQPAQSCIRNILNKSVTIGQAACLALFTGLLGLSASLVTAGGDGKYDNQITIIEDGSAGHIWDFSDTETDFMPVEPTISIEEDFEA